MKTKIIGLCGRSGSGKGYVSSVFEKYGGLCIDTDAVYHELLEPTDQKFSECTAELCENFGRDIIGDDMKPDRTKLSKIVFADKQKLKLLNEITHRYILSEVNGIISRSSSAFAVIDAPVLFESGFNKFCDFTVCVICSDETSVKRIIERDGISADMALKRLGNQLPSETLGSLCDYSIDNNGRADVHVQVKNILIDMGLYHEL